MYNVTMKQKVSVRAIIKQDEKTFFVRRSAGRRTILGKYELPGGKVGFNEQPDDALRRIIRDDTGMRVETIQLHDSIGYIDPDDSTIQYIFIVYLVSVSRGERVGDLASKYDKYAWIKMHDIQQSTLTNSTQAIVGIEQKQPLTDHNKDNDAIETTNGDHLVVYSDGGSRGNPGPSAAGYVVMNASEDILEESGAYLGITTNNQAEYQAVLLGLQRALELRAETVDFRIDSMLIVNQMSGVYKVKNRDLWPIYERIKELVGQFNKVTFTHVRREFNQRADAMVNKVLDEHSSGANNPNRL